MVDSGHRGLETQHSSEMACLTCTKAQVGSPAPHKLEIVMQAFHVLTLGRWRPEAQFTPQLYRELQLDYNSGLQPGLQEEYFK